MGRCIGDVISMLCHASNKIASFDAHKDHQVRDITQNEGFRLYFFFILIRYKRIVIITNIIELDEKNYLLII